jgi:hypothetical protein
MLVTLCFLPTNVDGGFELKITPSFIAGLEHCFVQPVTKLEWSALITVVTVVLSLLL